MLHATLYLDPHFTLGTVEGTMFGSFIEHLGRAVYDGVYCPGHPQAGPDGFRRDVAGLIRELNVPLLRYPGGNFVSGYRWEDGVGPRQTRPVRPDPAWRTLESNQVGLNEFAAFCRDAGTQMMLAVNLGTRGVQEACDLVEYCNLPGGSYYSDLRAAHGVAQPHAIRHWCLGNEMDGPWQTCHKTAEEYGRLAAETARAMRRLDPSVKLTVCGSSNPDMPTYPQWEATVLEHTYEDVDYLSLHQYLGDGGGDMGDFLAGALTTDRFIRTAVAACDYVQAKKRSQKRMMLSFDEWNVWYKTIGQEDRAVPWQHAPALLEEQYTMADAALFGTMLITLLDHADRVKVACLAQMVNVLAPIMTGPGGGPVWRQSIYWPFLHASRYGRGTALRTDLHSPKYDSPSFTDVPYLAAAAVLHEESGELDIFAVNRSTDQPLLLTLPLAPFGGGAALEHIWLCSPDPQTVNGPGHEPLTPCRRAGGPLRDETLQAELPPLSWNVLRLRTP